MKKTIRSGTLGVLCGVLLGALLTAGAGTILFGGAEGLGAALKFATVLRVIDQVYVGDYEPEQVTDAAAAGAVSALNDGWSYYLTAEEYAAYQDHLANRYQGIGVTIMQDEESGGFSVLAVTKDGPAQQAGIVVGDIILSVDGVSVVGEDTAFLRELILADFGGDAQVLVLRKDGSQEEFTVSCREVYSNPVTYELMGDTAYIRIGNFQEGAAAETIAAVEALRGEGAEYLVFDVRNNAGGQLTELVKLLDYLLPAGQIFIRADKAGNETVEFSDSSCVELPMAVLVNGDSYSAAEFFAAALREYEAAVVVGEPTTGKARSQVTVSLADGSAVHISKYTYLTPHRNDLYAAGGLVPDVETVLTEEERLSFDTGLLEPAEDPQLQAAIDAVHA